MEEAQRERNEALYVNLVPPGPDLVDRYLEPSLCLKRLWILFFAIVVYSLFPNSSFSFA